MGALGAPINARLAERLHGLASGLVNLVLPASCAACPEFVAAAGGLCAACWQRLVFIERPLCDRTGRPFAYDPGEGVVSSVAHVRPPVFGRARAAVVYDDVARRLVHALKYYDRHEVRRPLARLMIRAGSELIDGADVIVPVPLYPLRQWARRYNQSGLIARDIARMSGRPLAPRSLLRVKATRSQVGLNDSQRRRNVRDAFTVPASAIETVGGRRVLLVDDVITTGATLDACAEACFKAGAEAVDVLAFALVLRPVRTHI